MDETGFTSFGSYMDTILCQIPTAMPHAQVTQRNFYLDIDAKTTLVDEMTAAGVGWTATQCPN